MISEPPLLGIRVVELAGLAPAPFASLLLADYGASVLRIDRPHPHAHSSEPLPPTNDLLARRKSSIALDLKSFGGYKLLTDLLKHADVLIEPYRPGVLESLGLNPTGLLASNQRLIIARLTGFRRDGEYANKAGHDINYLAVSGVLSLLGRKGEAPYAPANILADFAGGGLMCAFGILMALFSRTHSGKGQVVESNMVDGSAFLGTLMRYLIRTPLWDQPRGQNLLDGGCPWYDVYECKDDLFEEQLILQRDDRKTWPMVKRLFKRRFLEKTRQDWETVFRDKDACCTPVLGLEELKNQGYEQRPAVRLMSTPGLKISQKEAWVSSGLSPGAGGEKMLDDWVGWKRDRDYKAENGSLIKIDAAKM